MVGPRSGFGLWPRAATAPMPEYRRGPGGTALRRGLRSCL